MIVAAHQPCFFPWMGYFEKIRKADIFVFLDQVLFARRARIQRVKIFFNQSPQPSVNWIGIPTIYSERFQVIQSVKTDENSKWRKKLLTTLHIHYGKGRGFKEAFPLIEDLLLTPEEGLSTLNAKSIEAISKYLGLETRFIMQSSINIPAVSEEKGSRRLAAICQALGATTYLAGDGAGEYEVIEEYEKIGLLYERNNFTPIPYFQLHSSTFVPGLSILDAMFNLPQVEIRALFPKSKKD